MDKISDSESEETNNHIHSTCQSLLSLDDMVLFKVMNHLNIRDLINLSNTCTRCGYLTQQHFEKCYSELRWTNNCHAIKPCKAKIIFRHIGKHIRAIELAFWTDFKFYEMLVILAENCTKLDTLILDTIRMNRPPRFRDQHMISLMFGKLQKFVLKECFWTGWCPLQTFFAENSTLKNLSVINCGSQSGIRLHLIEFKALKDLHLLGCSNELTSAELQRCFENNNITDLSLTNIGTINFFKRHLIDSLFHSIEGLTLDYITNIDLNQLVRLTKLKKLRLLCSVLNDDVNELLLKLNPDIEILEVTKICITKSTIRALTKFKKLKHLSFEGGANSILHEFFTILPRILPHLQQLVYTYNVVTDNDIIHMFTLMPKLKYLSLFGCNLLAADTYFTIIDILIQDSSRPKLKLIPPQLESLKLLNSLKNVKSVILC